MIQNINLLEHKRDHESRGGRLRMAIVGCALLATIVAAIAVLQLRTQDAVRTELARTLAETERLTQARSNMAGPSAAWMDEIAQEERTVLALEAVARQLVVGEFARTAGFTEELRAFGRAKAPGVWLTDMRLDNTTQSLQIEGHATASWLVPGLVHALEAEPHFHGTHFESFEIQNGTPDANGTVRDVTFRIVTPDTVEPGKRRTAANGGTTGAAS